ncbi:hypothetical protein X975_06723, partial [Stegodyphus mimosarum]
RKILFRSSKSCKMFIQVVKGQSIHSKQILNNAFEISI